MLQLTFQIERQADSEGLILEPITKFDIVKKFREEYNIVLYTEDITFLSNKGSNIYGEDEPPLELGLWLVKVNGLSECVKVWVVCPAENPFKTCFPFQPF